MQPRLRIVVLSLKLQWLHFPEIAELLITMHKSY